MAITSSMLSIIMPAYNEEHFIYANLLTVSETIATFQDCYEILLVNDGSLDHTKAEALRAAAKDSHIIVTGYDVNRGKGRAICYGVSEAKGDYIAFLDADLDLSPEHLEAFLQIMIEHNFDIVIGSKLHKESHLNYPYKRRIMSIGYYVLLRVLFHLRIKDTQTGIKLFRSSVIKPIASQIKTKSYAYDIEILARANQLGYTIAEMPIHLVFKRGKENGMGRIHLSDVWKMFTDTFRIYRYIKKNDKSA